MPRVLKTIDEIARELRRDVFYVSFPAKEADEDASDDVPEDIEFVECDEAHQNDEVDIDPELLHPIRKPVIDWLERQGLDYEDCIGPESLEGFRAWRGEVFLPELVLEPENALLEKVNEYLHTEANEMRFKGVALMLMRFEFAAQLERGRDESD